jgi:hypothetical protein
MYSLFHYTCSTCFGAICTHHQKHKLQSTVVGTRDCYGVLEGGYTSPLEQAAYLRLYSAVCAPDDGKK